MALQGRLCACGCASRDGKGFYIFAQGLELILLQVLASLELFYPRVQVYAHLCVPEARFCCQCLAVLPALADQDSGILRVLQTIQIYCRPRLDRLL